VLRASFVPGFRYNRGGASFVGFARRSSNLRNPSVLQSRWIIQDYVSFEEAPGRCLKISSRINGANRILHSPVCAASQQSWVCTFISKSSARLSPSFTLHRLSARRILHNPVPVKPDPCPLVKRCQTLSRFRIANAKRLW
jgi:hypothetical protein